jgi:triosephosphate isomerase
MLVINFKKYVSGEAAHDLAKICKKVSDQTGVKIIIAVQLADIYPEIECWSQKPEDPSLNFSGTLINHSDYPVSTEVISDQLSVISIKRCVCVNSVEEGIEVSKLNPDFIAYEPHELIGSKDKSVVTEKMSNVEYLISNVRCPVLIGAGIHSPEDIKIGLSLGAKGFLLATDVVKALDSEKELRELAFSYIKNYKI